LTQHSGDHAGHNRANNNTIKVSGVFVLFPDKMTTSARKEHGLLMNFGNYKFQIRKYAMSHESFEF